MSPFLSTAILRTQSDERLIVFAREGHERAFEALVERYRKPLLRHVRRVLPESRAEDALQQAFINAWRALERGDEVREPRAWLYRIAQNAALNAVRVSGYDYDELRESLHAMGGGPAEDHERREVMRRTLSGLAALPDAQRDALLGTAVEGRSHEELATELGLTEGAIRGLVYRARATLRAAATAITPTPLLGWAVAAASGGAPGSNATRIAELAAGGGTAGAGAVLAKAGAVLAVTGALATGAVVAGDDQTAADPEPAAASEAVQSIGARGGVPLAAVSRTGPGAVRVAGGRGGERGHGHSRGERGASGRRGGHSGDGHSGKGGSDDSKGGGSDDGNSGSGSSGSDSSGSGSSGRGSGSSGSGSGSGSGSSGSGSSGSGSSGSGSSGSGSSGSGSSGSGSSGSGSSGSDSSDSGSVDSGSTSDSSGSGSSGSGSSDSSGSGSSGSGSSGSGTVTTVPTTTSSSGSGSSGSGSGSSGSGSSGSG